MNTILKKPYDLSASPTLQHYFLDFETPFCGVMSHVNSGKTTCMVMKAHFIAANQHPDASGVRRSSHLFIRGTHGDLLRGLVRTHEREISSDLIKLRKSPPVGGHLKMQPLGDQNQHFPEFYYRKGKQYPYKIGGWDPELEDFYPDAIDVSGMRIGDVFPNGTFVDAILDFVPLDNPDWEQMLLGTEYTAAYFDEPDTMSNIDELLTKLPGRLGRYPPAHTAPLTCTQINLAYNPPRKDCFTEKFFSPENEHLGRKLYRIQPPFLLVPDPEEPNNFFKAEFIRNPNAEGVRFAAKGFAHWQEIIDANRHDANKIRRDVLGEYTHGSGGELVHVKYRRDRHVATEHLTPDRTLKLFVSLDWGTAGACLIGQVQGYGLKIFEELPGEGMMANEFVNDSVLPHLHSEYAGYDFVITGDPSGRFKTNMGEGPFSIFEDRGYQVEKFMSNNPQDRWSAVNYYLGLHEGLLIDPRCVELIKGFDGDYVFQKTKQGNSRGTVDKTLPITAYQDCLQAMCQLVQDGYEVASTTYSAMDRYGSYEKETVIRNQEDILWA